MQKSRIFPFHIKAEEIEEQEDRFTFQGYASIFGKADRMDDIVERGAFKQTLNHHKGEAFPIAWMHNLDFVLGGAYLEEDKKGLKVREGFLLKGIEKAREVNLLMKAGVVNGMSFSYDVIKSDRDGQYNRLKELRLGEVTLATRSLAANPDATVDMASVKTLLSQHNTEVETILFGKVWEDEEGWTEIRYQVRKDSEFERIRSWWLKDNSIRALGGPLKDGGETKIQSLRFLKDAGWTLKEAKEWVAEHRDELKTFESIWAMNAQLNTALERASR